MTHVAKVEYFVVLNTISLLQDIRWEHCVKIPQGVEKTQAFAVSTEAFAVSTEAFTVSTEAFSVLEGLEEGYSA